MEQGRVRGGLNVMVVMSIFAVKQQGFFGADEIIFYTQDSPWYKLALQVCTTTTFILFFNFIHKCFALRLGR